MVPFPRVRYSRLPPSLPRRQNLSAIFSADLCDHIQQFRQRRHTPLRLQTLYFRLKLCWAEFECPDRENFCLFRFFHFNLTKASAINCSALSHDTCTNTSPTSASVIGSIS